MEHATALAYIEAAAGNKGHALLVDTVLHGVRGLH